MIGHPSSVTLNRYQDGELSPRKRARVAGHLAGCQVCRGRIQEWRAAATAIREGAIPELPADLFERIQSRRASGERMILPVGDPPRPRRERRSIVAAAAMIAGLVIGYLAIVTTPELRADASELRLTPAAPAPGEQVHAEYRASSLLSGHDRLVLRARYRTETDDYIGSGTHGVITELEKGGDGVFRGSFRLPDSVVYAIFAVADPEAKRVDSNGRRGWDLLVHAADGRPLPAALSQKMHDLTTRNWEQAYETARTAADLYPERVESWYILSFFEQAVMGEAGVDSLARTHRERLLRLHDALATRPAVAGDDAGYLFFYAIQVGDTVISDHWRERLEKEHPAHPLAVQNRVVSLLRKHWGEPAPVLAEMERMWDEIGPVHVQQGDHGYGAARRLGDPETIRRWADRYLHFRPSDALWVATTLGEVPELREEAKRRLRQEIRRLTALRSEERELFSTAEDQHRQTQHELRSHYGALGRTLVANGATRAALDTLALAVATGWDTRLFRDVAEARFAAGDPAGALELWARVAVDPATSEAFPDSVRAHTGGGFDEARWLALTDRARGTMRNEVLADATRRSVRGRVRLVDVEGRTQSLDDLSGGRPAVVVFLSRGCGPAIEALPEIDRIAKRLSARGVRLVTVIQEKPDAEIRALFAERGLSLPVFHDSHRDAARAFEQYGTPQYFVLDETGRIRFEYTSLDALERQVAVLAPSA
jgi:thiol-disulfide isomerase/thioredoxin